MSPGPICPPAMPPMSLALAAHARHPHPVRHRQRDAVRLPGASVRVQCGHVHLDGNVVTTAGGGYCFDLPAGTYKLFIQPDEAGFADQWVGGTDHATADVVNLSSGNATKNVALVGPPSSHTLSGTVTAGGPGLSGASVHVFDAGTYTWIGYVVTTAGGAYSIDLPAGTYKLFIQPDEPGYADQWVGGADHASASVVDLSSGNATQNVALVGPPSSVHPQPRRLLDDERGERPDGGRYRSAPGQPLDHGRQPRVRRRQGRQRSPPQRHQPVRDHPRRAIARPTSAITMAAWSSRRSGQPGI